jgi:hypothetical protein
MNPGGVRADFTFAQGTHRLGGAVDTDALDAYLTPSLTGAPFDPPAPDRIDVAP